jgi:signal transduction histidine kinase
METAHREDLLHRNIEQVEAERHRIAADLHDELGGIFSTLKLKINQAI